MRASPEADILVISYPKSGRTWLRVLLGKALCLQYGLTADSILDTLAITAAAGLPRADFSHDGTDLHDALDHAALSEDKGAYRHRKVIFLARDVRDVLVSSYFEATKRADLFDANKRSLFEGTLSEFVRSPIFGVRKVAVFYDIWARNRAVPKDFLLVHYEQLRVAPGELLQRVLRFIGADDVARSHIAEATSFGSFANMRRLEKADMFDDPRLRPGDPSDPESYKVRRGVVGGYIDYLASDDIVHVERELACRAWPLAARSSSSTARRSSQPVTPCVSGPLATASPRRKAR
jgi:hypothetical protein